jgi:glycosyltransferase involved in cell wall biosynthesis
MRFFIIAPGTAQRMGSLDPQVAAAEVGVSDFEMRVALVHDWLVGMRGGEKCLEVFCELFPDADLYTLIYLPDTVSATIRRMRVKTSWIQQVPAVERYYRYFLPLFPAAMEGFDLSGYDLILSSSHCVAKGIFPHRALHISYVHAPMRYVWDMREAYFAGKAGPLAWAGLTLCRPCLQRWDVKSAARVDCFIANSRNVAEKIKRLYGRSAEVIYPPVNLDRFKPGAALGSHYLIVSALVPYKRIDVAVEAFNTLQRPLKIVGVGPLRRALERKAKDNIEFLGWVDDLKLGELYANCRALIFPGEEDCGIVPLEAQASGRPVIAYNRGGALETVIGLDEGSSEPTGIFYDELSAGALVAAILRFEQSQQRFDPNQIRNHASRFDRLRFKEEVGASIDRALASHRAGNGLC